MNAKEAICAEMGDLFLDNPTVVAQDATMNKEEEGLLVSADDNTFDTASTWDESDDEDSSDDSEAFADDTSDDIADDTSDDISDDTSDDTSDDDDSMSDDFEGSDDSDSDATADAPVPSLFDYFDNGDDSDDASASLGANAVASDMTDEDRDACIEAADAAMTDPKMPPEIFDWGLDFIRKMYEEKDAQLRAKIESIDWNAARARWAQEAAQEEEQERAEREKYLREQT